MRKYLKFISLLLRIKLENSKCIWRYLDNFLFWCWEEYLGFFWELIFDWVLEKFEVWGSRGIGFS